MQIVTDYSDRRSIMAQLDVFALEYYNTKDKKIFDKFAVLLDKIVRPHIDKWARGTPFDKDELYSILLTDTWRLLQEWRPVPEKKFHWLLLRQLKNKTINFIRKESCYHPLKRCPKCSFVHKEKQMTCDNCHCCMSLQLTPVAELKYVNTYAGIKWSGSKIDHRRDPELVPARMPSFVDQLVAKDMVDKLFSKIDDDKTKQILLLILDGEEAHDVLSKLSNMSVRSVENRLKKCRKLIEKLCKERSQLLPAFSK